MSDDSIGLSTAQRISPLDPEKKMQPGSFQLNLFDQSDGPTLSSFLVGSSVILTMAQLAGVKLRNRYLHFDTSLGLPTRTGLQGYLDGVAIYPMQVLLRLIDT